METLLPRGDGSVLEQTEQAQGLSFTDSGELLAQATCCSDGLCSGRTEIRHATGGRRPLLAHGDLHPTWCRRDNCGDPGASWIPWARDRACPSGD